MSVEPDFLQLVNEGEISKYSGIRKFGVSDDIGVSSKVIWPGTGEYQGILTEERNLALVSTSAQDSITGTGAYLAQAEILDSNYNMKNVIIQANGTTPVTTDIDGNQLRGMRCNRMYFLRKADVSGHIPMTNNSNVGVVSLYETTGSRKLALIRAQEGQTQQCVYTVPNGYEAYPTLLTPATGQGKQARIDVNIIDGSQFNGSGSNSPIRGLAPIDIYQNLKQVKIKIANKLVTGSVIAAVARVYSTPVITASGSIDFILKRVPNKYASSN